MLFFDSLCTSSAMSTLHESSGEDLDGFFVSALWERVNFSDLNSVKTSVIVIHVYQGGISGHQIGPFQAAFADVQTKLLEIVSPRTIEAQYMTISDVCAQSWSIKQLVDWLLNSSIHFILTHVHQGFESHGNILNMKHVEMELMRLQFHEGFPNGLQLYCPVFTQNKFRYLECLDDFTAPTISILLTSNGKFDVETSEVIGRLVVFVCVCVVVLV